MCARRHGVKHGTEPSGTDLDIRGSPDLLMPVMMRRMTGEAVQTSEMTARERILRTVLDLIPEHGADRITHRLVSAEAEVSPGTVTYHFASIDDLMEEAFHLYMEEYEAGLETALAARPLTSRTDIVRFLMTLIAMGPEQADLARIEYAMVGFAQRNAVFHEEVAAWSKVLEDRMAESLGALGAAGPQDRAKLLLRLCRGAEFDVLARGDAVDADAFERLLLSLTEDDA
jgi:AcrR family transcriptional regulator